MKINKAIKYFKKLAKQMDNDAIALEEEKPSYPGDYDLIKNDVKKCRKDAENYRQVAKWLKELKAIHKNNKYIVDRLMEKFAYLNMCLNEQDIILRTLGLSNHVADHCNTDCNNSKCESYHYKNLGEWIYGQDDPHDIFGHWTCSKCGFVTEENPEKDYCFCPRCGNKMKVEDSE